MRPEEIKHACNALPGWAFRPCLTPGGRVAFGVRPEMCNNRKIGGKPAAPAKNTTPATFPASEVDEREGQAENGVVSENARLHAECNRRAMECERLTQEIEALQAEKAAPAILQTLTLSEYAVSGTFHHLSQYAVALVTGNFGGRGVVDYQAAQEVCGILAELETACKTGAGVA